MSNLNLARKLRPKTFNEIIGQDLSISMLKNSLYLKKFFPVYLFSGQRGCGKTSTARVFGAATNCQAIKDFQKDAKNNTIPCLTCDSCKSMQKSNHPDFIEMDAASHTGVDSVRQIIESCTYMPISGAKKIYLIDEAHMLSRAAFNAFLKILEEPPSSTIFILATTEPEKIPDTVRSRCFQVTFNAVEQNKLSDHIEEICRTEEIAIEKDAVKLIVQENDGSVRDAINTLEQVRFSGEKITKELIEKSLGKISESQLLELVKIVVDQNPKKIIEKLQKIQFESICPKSLWDSLALVLREILWSKHDVSQEVATFKNNYDEIKDISQNISRERINTLLKTIWSNESLFIQTTKKHTFLENVLLQMTHQKTESKATPEKKNPVESKPVESKPTVENKWESFADFLDKKKTKPNDNTIRKHIQVETNTSKTNQQFTQSKSIPRSAIGSTIDVSDGEKWPKANLLRKHFSGRIEKVRGEAKFKE